MKKLIEARWTILFIGSGYVGRQRQKRFWGPDNFKKAKALGISKIGKGIYQGLFRWSEYDFQAAVKSARLKLLRKRKNRRGPKQHAQLNEIMDEEKCFAAMEAN